MSMRTMTPSVASLREIAEAKAKIERLTSRIFRSADADESASLDRTECRALVVELLAVQTAALVERSRVRIDEQRRDGTDEEAIANEEALILKLEQWQPDVDALTAELFNELDENHDGKV